MGDTQEENKINVRAIGNRKPTRSNVKVMTVLNPLTSSMFNRKSVTTAQVAHL